MHIVKSLKPLDIQPLKFVEIDKSTISIKFTQKEVLDKKEIKLQDDNVKLHKEPEKSIGIVAPIEDANKYSFADWCNEFPEPECFPSIDKIYYQHDQGEDNGYFWSIALGIGITTLVAVDIITGYGPISYGINALRPILSAAIYQSYNYFYPTAANSDTLAIGYHEPLNGETGAVVLSTPQNFGFTGASGTSAVTEDGSSIFSSSNTGTLGGIRIMWANIRLFFDTSSAVLRISYHEPLDGGTGAVVPYTGGRSSIFNSISNTVAEVAGDAIRTLLENPQDGLLPIPTTSHSVHSSSPYSGSDMSFDDTPDDVYDGSSNTLSSVTTPSDISEISDYEPLINGETGAVILSTPEKPISNEIGSTPGSYRSVPSTGKIGRWGSSSSISDERGDFGSRVARRIFTDESSPASSFSSDARPYPTDAPPVQGGFDKDVPTPTDVMPPTINNMPITTTPISAHEQSFVNAPSSVVPQDQYSRPKHLFRGSPPITEVGFDGASRVAFENSPGESCLSPTDPTTTPPVVPATPQSTPIQWGERNIKVSPQNGFPPLNENLPKFFSGVQIPRTPSGILPKSAKIDLPEALEGVKRFPHKHITTLYTDQEGVVVDFLTEICSKGCRAIPNGITTFRVLPGGILDFTDYTLGIVSAAADTLREDAESVVGVVARVLDFDLED